MKRFYLSCVIFVALFVTSWIVLKNLETSTIELTNALDEVIILWENKENQKVLEKVEEINTLWEKYKKKMDITINTNILADITASVAKLKPFLLYESDEFFSECSSIKFSLQLIYENHKPSLDAIF